MTKNFKILADIDFSRYQSEIVKKIDKIEKSILQGTFDYLFLEGRNILELLFSEISENINENMDANLEQKIFVYTNLNIVPSKVKNAFYFIKNKGNEDAHASLKNTDKPFTINKDIFSIVEFLKHVFIVIKHFVSVRIEGGHDLIKEYDFDSNIYLPKTQTIEKEIDEIEDVKPDKDPIETNLKGIFELIVSDYNFFIPTYQREYSWNESNILTLIQDIKDRSVDQTHHYMGSLAIVVKEKDKNLRLIDGQQRITTSLLLIKAMIKRFNDFKKSLNMPKELEEIKDKLKDKYINQTTAHGPVSYVKKILKNLFPSDKDFKNSHGYKNYQLITEELNKLSIKEFDNFYTTFIYHFVVAELRFKTDLGQEIAIFENLNSKGMQLSQWDLIKNQIFRKIKFDLLLKRESDIEILLNHLFVIKASKFFGEKKKISKLSDFFAIYCRIMHKLLKNEVLQDKGKIHKIFAHLWDYQNQEKISTMEELEEALLFIAKCFEIYCLLDQKNLTNNPESPLFELNLHLLNTSAKDAHYAVLINAIINSSNWNQAELIKIKKDKIKHIKEFLADIDKYITRLLVVRNVGQSLSNTFDAIITDDVVDSHKMFLTKISTSSANLAISLPSWNDFKFELKNKNDWQKEYAFAVLRTLIYDHNSFTNKVYEIILNPSLEHIFPQKVKDDSTWYLAEATNRKNGLSFERFLERKQSKINKLGNYLILSQSLNSKVKNGAFIEKLKSYKTYGSSKLIFGLSNNQLMDLTLKNSFTFEDIDERTKQLAELIAPLYKLSNGK